MDHLDRKSFYIALLVMFCVYVGANNTQYREYLPYDAGNCPRDYQCPYRPNEEPFDIKSVIKSIKNQFK
jgi:hypothetical protein